MRAFAPLVLGLGFAAAIVTVVVAAPRPAEACGEDAPLFLVWLEERSVEPSAVICLRPLDDPARLADRLHEPGVAGVVLDRSTMQRLPEDARSVNGAIYVALGAWWDELDAALRGHEPPSPSARERALASDAPAVREHAALEHHAIVYRVATTHGTSGARTTVEAGAPLDRLLLERAEAVRRATAAR